MQGVGVGGKRRPEQGELPPAGVGGCSRRAGAAFQMEGVVRLHETVEERGPGRDRWEEEVSTVVDEKMKR